ncbi:VOC family protein [Aeoliella mucimassa]|uniref:Glyoxalase-like domain protein n=1 Tax=Aeoliella mucimassa TaxID=2527972 RepID=A0A518AIP9_9BACT|nr:VOC family protein [Aeoliella mucimassa]QDU54586.1 Glyoxalase-like domain protein [Aeoliella mucimassa]
MNAARLSMITLGVADIAESKAFYEKLGWRASSSSNDSVVFFHSGTAVLGLYDRQALADDATVANDGAGFDGVAMAMNFASEADVDAAFAHAVECGASAVKAPQKVFWGGYSGYFADPDGHLWEVAHNPFVELDEQGRMQLPD